MQKEWESCSLFILRFIYVLTKFAYLEWDMVDVISIIEIRLHIKLVKFIKGISTKMSFSVLEKKRAANATSKKFYYGRSNGRK